jgi:hypothetical protein
MYYVTYRYHDTLHRRVCVRIRTEEQIMNVILHI